MKCATELMALAKEGETLRLLEEVENLEKARLQAIARAKYTLEWCETVLSNYLEKYALNHAGFGKGEWSYEFSNGHSMHFDIQDSYLRHLQPYHKYANGQRSFRPCGEYLDKQVIIDYCAKHCIEVRSRQNNYKMYGSGVRYGVELEYRISPECFQ